MHNYILNICVYIFGRGQLLFHLQGAPRTHAVSDSPELAAIYGVNPNPNPNILGLTRA